MTTRPIDAVDNKQVPKQSDISPSKTAEKKKQLRFDSEAHELDADDAAKLVDGVEHALEHVMHGIMHSPSEAKAAQMAGDAEGKAFDMFTGSQARRDDNIAVVNVSDRHDVRQTGVRMDIYTSWLKDELDTEYACLELPMTITLLISFTFMALFHLQQDRVGIIENAITLDIEENANFAFAHAFGHKGIEDVNSYADFWSWTRVGLLPLLTGSWSYSEDLASAVPKLPGRLAYDVDSLPSQRTFPSHRKAVPIRNEYLRFNRIIGGIRMRQQVAMASNDKCTFPSSNEVFTRWMGKPCATEKGGELPPDLAEAEEFSNAMRTEWILTETGDLSMAAQAMVDMEDGCTSATKQNRTCLCKWCAGQSPPMPWLNELTTRIQISFCIFNPTHGLYSQASVNFWFNRAGHIYKLISVRSAWMTLFSRPMFDICAMLLADTIWLSVIFYVFYNEAKDVVCVLGKSKRAWYHAICEEYMGFWNIVDWVSIAVAMTIIALGLLLTFAIMETNDGLAGIAKLTLAGIPDQGELQERVTKFFNSVEAMLNSESAFRFQLVLYPSVLMLRLFKSFAAQPRLAIVTDTFVEARSDIFHFFIVFFSVYVCMVVNAVLFFGQDSVDFATAERAFHSCFLVMFGDWDYDSMESIGRMKASLWFWIFMIVVVLILQNIMLAILMEAYSNVKNQTSDAPTLIEQVKTQYRRWRQARRKERLRLNDIFDALLEAEGGDEDAMMSNSKVIFPSDVQAMVPNLQAEQAIRTMKNSKKDFDKAHSDPFTTDHMSPNMHGLKDRYEQSLVGAAYIAEKLKEYDKIERPSHECEMPEDDFEEDPEDLKRAATVECSGKGSKPEMNHDDDLLGKKAQLQEGLDEIRKLTQKNTVELSDAMEAVVAEEMQGLERRQVDQRKSMELMQESLKALRASAYKLSETCVEVGRLSSLLGPVTVVAPIEYDNEEGPDVVEPEAEAPEMF